MTLTYLSGYNYSIGMIELGKTKEVEARAKSLGLPMAFICRRAKVPAATWSRWKAGKQQPTQEKWDAITAALIDTELRLK